jgi:hypothetical protein
MISICTVFARALSNDLFGAFELVRLILVFRMVNEIGELLSNFVDEKSQAAIGFLTPSTKTVPAITSGSNCDPFNALHFFDALSISL